MRYIPLVELLLFVGLVILRAYILCRQGIKAFVFGETQKSDFTLIPIVLLFFYALLASIFALPFPAVMVNPFWHSTAVLMGAITVCTLSLVWFALTLSTFGASFRVGIDENAPGKLIAEGPFALSRNPIYLAFISFFTGIFFAYPNLSTLLFLLLLWAFVHRQILREEKFLVKHYGKEYEDYCARVRRYL